MSQNSGNYIVRLHILPNLYSQVVLLMRVSTQVIVYFCGRGSNDSLIFRAFFGAISVDLVYVTAAATTGVCWCFLQRQSGQAERPGSCVLRRRAGFLVHLLWTDSLCQCCLLHSVSEGSYRLRPLEMKSFPRPGVIFPLCQYFWPPRLSLWKEESQVCPWTDRITDQTLVAGSLLPTLPNASWLTAQHLPVGTGSLE